jgi:hypothetical protein
MVRQPVRLALLIGAIVAAATTPAQANHKADCSGPVSGTGPAFRTIQVTECVPETYKVKRIVNRIECKTEEYDAFKCISVPEERTRECIVVKCVPVQTVETRKVCKNITVFEERTVVKKEWRTVTETCMEKKLVRLGHWECYEAPAHFSNLFARHHSDPCDPCAAAACPKTRTKKRWVHCPEYVCCPKTVCKKVCVEVPTVCKVPVCKQVWEEVNVNVCRYNRIEEKQLVKYTVCVQKQVAYKATRTVRVCVPTEEEVTCTRMVARCVERQVPVCTTTCSSPCESTSCCTSSRGHGLFNRSRGHGNCCR